MTSSDSPDGPDGSNGPSDTIAAVATGAGRAGVGIVRVSGPRVPHIADAVLARTLVPRTATYAPFLDGTGAALDVGIALRFVAPDSFTGEHVLELQGHGGPVVLDRVLARVLSLGARAARPGEFSERAFLNDKLDLAQAEAIADLIDSASESAARAAVRSLSGEFSADVQALVDDLVGLRVWLEAALDFSEEEIDFLADPALDARAVALLAGFDRVLARAGQGQRLRDGLTVAIAGRPNVGKSSLMNRLAGVDAAIVTDVPGTTRDVLREDIVLDGVPLRIIDTAGLRDTDDPVERIGIERARAALALADHVLLVIAADDPAPPEESWPAGLAVTRVINKRDAVSDAALQAVLGEVPADRARLAVSAVTGEGLDELRAHLLSLAGHDAAVEGVYLARRRHLDALHEARSFTEAGLQRLRSGVMPELAAEELRQAQDALNRITGRFDADDLLGAIFGSFCVGK